MLGSLLGLFLLILHIGQTGSFPPPLSEKEEHELLKKMAENDESARAELIEHNLRLVAHIVKKYYANADDQDDLISIGTIGLIKGVDSYKPEKKVRLATYAAKCVENEILMYFRKKKRTANEISLSEHIDTDKDGNELSLIDVISEEDRILDTVCQKMRVERLLEGIRTQLDGRERTIIEPVWHQYARGAGENAERSRGSSRDFPVVYLAAGKKGSSYAEKVFADNATVIISDPTDRSLLYCNGRIRQI